MLRIRCHNGSLLLQGCRDAEQHLTHPIGEETKGMKLNDKDFNQIAKVSSLGLAALVMWMIGFSLAEYL
ncbi:MAG: hypothetical protein ACWA5X_13870 [bacterium]